ncbi:hypothetical protein M2318_003933 [Metapseudomonas resinovorans]|uniref:hypothetical protein n=1 Tax=Metapseudomonas resinovorans TaxID=53412 RepID=UPI003D256CAA
MYDIAHLAQLRKDAEYNGVDFGRAQIEPTPDGNFAVKLKAPIVDVAGLLDPLPQLHFVARSALQAEARMLDSLIKIQRAERQRVRLGRVTSWSPMDIVRRPLTAEEVAAFKADLAHQQKVAELQAELAAALQAKQAAGKAKAQAAEIAGRYGARPAAPVPVAQAVEEVEPVPGVATADQPRADLITVEALLAQAPQAGARRHPNKRK